MGIADNLRANPRPVWKRRPELLLTQPVPAPMHGLAPRVVLGKRWWDAVRFAAYRSTGYCCAACGVKRFGEVWCQWLEGHEVYEIDYLVGRMVYVETVPMCQRCHAFVHPGYLRLRLDEGIITPADYRDVVDHGERVLREARLDRRYPYEGPMADWSDWRLVVGDVEYPPLFASAEERDEEYRDAAVVREAKRRKKRGK